MKNSAEYIGPIKLSGTPTHPYKTHTLTITTLSYPVLFPNYFITPKYYVLGLFTDFNLYRYLFTSSIIHL
jgi:hypothetical protein